ncbi:MAG: RdgB/HAM1 family non-canonical purine NTP pyrophosphatase [Ornithinimicrobium sp.]|uniref:RdgB/HAM1 family non-canonical purine NTP pyrophosphatase n=1 Tax=Ornithinimicrobium sp. TaxID=1977084 RepID=UPI0026E081A0|nr:RdgB/HAM1 family non-canonical purine NTP pyrophosphatase [Ornithinimicrobium sp.]MDO5738902.1 RdgB/HAM1 family non-canonical purine NTP pyrophosphatase [Ornithinimicrobium sp.]
MSDGQADRRLVLATRNAHKVVELREILRPVLEQVGLELVGLDAFEGLEDVVESGVTFADNALLKARYAAAATGLPALADDSGLAVDVLGGSPGVFSARWSGPLGEATGLSRDEANNVLVLAQLADVPDGHRAASFVCAAALVLPGAEPGTVGEEIVRHGHCRGVVAHQLRGTGGFGFDPLLLRPDGRTLAEHSAQEKNAISHRGEAFRALGADLTHRLGQLR